MQLVPTRERFIPSREFSSHRRSIWGLMEGCESVVGENGYPLGSLSSVSKSTQRAGVCGPLTFVIAGLHALSAALSILLVPLMLHLPFGFAMCRKTRCLRLIGDAAV